MFQEWQAAAGRIARPAGGAQATRERQPPQLHIAPVASGHTVRGDNPFEEIGQFVRTTAAIDMEGAAFYRAATGFPGTHSLWVKGVSDFADSEKNDIYHDYASTVSAVYIICFIQEFVTSERFPLECS